MSSEPILKSGKTPAVQKNKQSLFVYYLLKSSGKFHRHSSEFTLRHLMLRARKQPLSAELEPAAYFFFCERFEIVRAHNLE